MPRTFTPAVDCTHEDRQPIELKPVESSQIKAIGYDEDSQTAFNERLMRNLMAQGGATLDTSPLLTVLEGPGGA